MRRDHRVFLGYQFKSDYFTKADLDHAVSVAVESASAAVSQRFEATVSFSPMDVTPGHVLFNEVRLAIKNASICIFEISDLNNNVFYEIGLAQGLGIPTILLVSKTSLTSGRVPSDLQGVIYLEYAVVSEIRGRLGKYVADILATVMTANSDQAHRAYLKQLWLGSTSTDTVFVSGDIRGNSKTIGGFINYVRNGDARALLESVVTILSLDNTIPFETTASELVSGKSLTQNIIAIGGPKANRITKNILERYEMPWRYKYDERGNYRDKAICNSVTGVELRAALDDEDEVVMDYGMILVAPNPFNPANNCVVLTGLYTFGVLGGVKAISLTDRSQVVHSNINIIRGLDHDSDRLLQIVVQTDIVDRKVITPTVRHDWVVVRDVE